MYNTTTTTISEKKLAAYRISPITIERLKEMAKMENTSVNSLVDEALTELVKDVRTKAELEAAQKATDEFINEFAGIWSGKGNEDIDEIIFSNRAIRKPVDL